MSSAKCVSTKKLHLHNCVCFQHKVGKEKLVELLRGGEYRS